MAYTGGAVPGEWSPEDDSPTAKLAEITASSTPLMKQARTQGLQSANRRGLLNSTMAVGAAQDSAYRAAVPLAQQSADQTFQKNLSLQSFGQQGELQGRELASLETRQGRDLASQENIAAMNVAAHDRQYAQSALAAADQTYGNMFAQIAANERIPAAQRTQYLTMMQKMRDSQINLVQQLYDIQLDWTTPSS